MPAKHLKKSPQQENSPPEPTEAQKVYALIQRSLYANFSPFPGQVELGKAIFHTGVKLAFGRCGRGWGKTLACAWLASKWALERKNQIIYILAPLSKQVKEIYWYPKLLEQFAHPDFITKKDNQETFYEFWNGSRIKLDGSDNYDSQRGVRPNLVVADEYADFDARWIDVMAPNIGKVGGTLLTIGTPPEFPVLANGRKHHYVQLDERARKLQQEAPNRAYHITAPTSDNPFYPVEELADAKQRLHDLGMAYVWEREYMARIVLGSERAIFPMFSYEKHVIAHADLLEHLGEDLSRYEWFCSADPGTKSVFAVVFMAIDRYTSTPYVLDEIYETDPSLTTTQSIIPRIREKVEELYPNWSEWSFICDNAAAWFIEDAFTNHGLSFEPTQKQSRDKQDGIVLLKDIFLQRSKIISDRCQNVIHELSNYMTDEKGRIRKVHDHTIDNIRYILKHSLFSFVGAEKPRRESELRPEKRYYTLEEDLIARAKEEDWTFGIA